MAQITWQHLRDWMPNSFSMQVISNERMFSGYYSGQSQVIDLMGESWIAQFTLPARKGAALGAQREAMVARLRRSNTLLLWHLQRPVPRGTMRGTPTLSSAVAQLASTVNIQSTAGATLLDGDLIGLGGQVSMVDGDYTANGSGVFSNVKIWPRARAAISSGAAVAWDKPTVEFRNADSRGAPVVWLPASVSESLTVSLAEA